MKHAGKLSAHAPRALVAAAGLLLSLPVWFHGWAAGGDAIFHGSWYAHFSAQLGAGELYPRWLAGMNAGLGSPAFYYYPPLPYYFASFVGLFVPAGAGALRAPGAAAAFAYTLSGLTAYAWLRKISGARPAAVAAILYLLVPYHSAVDLYTREAYAELWAFVWMPLALKYARGVADDSRPDRAPARVASSSAPDPERGSATRDSGSNSGLSFGSNINRLALPSSGANSVRPAALSFGSNFVRLAAVYALLCASHPPATLIFSPVAVAYAYWHARRAGAALRAALALALGACLSAVYLLPALAMQDAVSFGDMLAFHYFERWLTFTRPDARDLYGLLLWGTLTTLALIACAACVRRGRDDNQPEFAKEQTRRDASPSERTVRDTPPSEQTRRAASYSEQARRAETTFWLVIAALSALLTTSASGPVWRALPVLQRVQFPWRFSLLLSLAAAAIVALGLSSLREPGARANRRMLVFGGLIVCAWLVLLAGVARHAYPSMAGRDLVVNDAARAAFAHGRDAPEYRPRWTNLSGEGDAERRLLLRVCGGDATREVRACISEGDGAIAFTRRAPRELELTVESASGVSFRVTQLYFPGWAARLDGRPHAIQPAPADGLIMLSVPAGQHRLRLALEPTAPERAGQLLSAASLAVILLLSLPRALGRIQLSRNNDP